ncbi:hypothetical protein [Streptomyces calidiresistens]|uniref:Membrane protein YmcC n=1 Tax=Streptomyces calidiresistens TaxID=1485586 RepID=A0A7W3T2W9_9ACTN|nr:hypothetical protein [Streptomyces calidiresistens]MBB0229954.1 hypothetical protein [Streptomyces calidiresistens]
MLFWVFLVGGLTARYAAGLRVLGGALLLCVPLIDVVLLAATVISIRDGAEPTVWHGLSAAYLSMTVVYGHRIVRWADAKFARRHGASAAPPRPTLHGRAAVVDAWRSWFRFLLAYVMSVALIYGLVVLAGGLDRGAPLLVWLNPLTKVLLYSLIWPVVITIWPGKAPEPASDEAAGAG